MPNCVVLQLAAVENHGLPSVLNSAGLRTDILNLLDDRHGAFVSNLTKHNVLAIEPGSLDGSDEELRAVSVGAGVGHGQETRTSVLVDKVLVGKLLAIDGFATSAIAAREVTSLKHKLRDYTVETGSLVAEALLAGAEGTEVLDSLGDIIIKIEEDPPRLHALGVLPLHIKVALNHLGGR